MSVRPEFDPTDDDRAVVLTLLDKYTGRDEIGFRAEMALLMAHLYLSDVSAGPGDDWAAHAVRRARACLDYHMEDR